MGKPRIRSKVRCPYCDFPYEKFRADGMPSFQAAYEMRFQQSKQAHAEGDYSLNAYRGTVLGLMRMLKQAAWENDHLYWCRMEATQSAPEDEVPF